MPQDPRLAAALEASRRESRDAVASLKSMTASIRREQQAYRQARRPRDAERAREARDGTLGPEVRAVQARVDAGQTTWDDVLQGRDDHPSAQAVRANVERNLDEVAERVRTDPDLQDEQEQMLAAEARARAEQDLP